MQNNYEEKAYILGKEIANKIENKTNFSRYLKIVIVYQEGIMGSQKTILYICKKFKKSIGSSMSAMRDTRNSLGPKSFDEEEEEASTLLGFETGDMDDLFGSEEDLDSSLEANGVEAEGEDMVMFLDILKG